MPGDRRAADMPPSIRARALAAAALGAVITFVASLVLLRGSPAYALPYYAGIGFVVAFALGCVIGLPLHVFFRRLGIRGLIPYLLAGLAPALLLSVVKPISLAVERRTTNVLFDWPSILTTTATLWIPCGLVGSAVFWSLIVRNTRH